MSDQSLGAQHSPVLTPNYRFIEPNSSVARLTGTEYTIRPPDPTSPALMMPMTWPLSSTDRYFDVVVGIEGYVGFRVTADGDVRLGENEDGPGWTSGDDSEFGLHLWPACRTRRRRGAPP